MESRSVCMRAIFSGLSEKNRGRQMAVFDGDTRVEMEAGDQIEIERSETAVRIVRLDHRSFLDILKHKLGAV